MELYEKNGKLVSRENWEKTINKLKEEKIAVNNPEKEYTKILEKAIKKRLTKEKQGILFSGGIDSSTIAYYLKKLGANTEIVCVSISGFKEAKSEDKKEAKKIAKILDLKVHYEEIPLEKFEEILKETLTILPKEKHDVVNVGVGAVEVIGIKKLKELGAKNIWGGLGSEELFAGYQRHEQAEDIDKECFKGLLNMWDRDLIRETSIGAYYKVEGKTPFLDEELIKYSFSIPTELKRNKEQDKRIVRKTMEPILGQKAWRKKRAAQYGSRADLGILQLSKKAKCKTKKEYLKKLQNI